MKTITTLNYKSESFLIVKKLEHTNKPGEVKEMYLAINKKYIDEDGRLNTQLNGFQMHASESMKMCMNGAMDEVDINELQSQGIEITPEVISNVVTNSGRYN